MKVLVADDEGLIRFSLKSMIDELDLPLTVVAEAANGDELIHATERHQPDIGLVDIRMPGVSGLQAIRRARKSSAATRWVILTSHAEFDYASEAIQLGVGAYLLKPAGPAQLNAVLAPLIEDITRERTAANAGFAQSLILGLDAAGRGSSRPPFSPCWAGVIQLDFAASLTPLERAARQESVMAALHGLASPSGDNRWLAACWTAELGTLRVVMAPPEPVDDLVRRWQSSITAFVKHEAEDLRLSGAGNGLVSSWSELASLFERCDAVLAYRGVLGTGTFRDTEDWSRRVDSLSAPAAALGTAINGFLKAWEKGHGPDLRMLLEQLVERFTASLGSWEPAARYLAYRTGIEAPRDETAEVWASRFLTAARSAVPEVRKSVDAQVRIVEGIDEYLSRHLVDEVRVPDIAAFLSLSPNYLSSLYRKMAGTTISGRLTELRLTRARELLSLPGNAVKTVAMEVGYKSTRHFARLYLGRFGHYPSGR